MTRGKWTYMTAGVMIAVASGLLASGGLFAQTSPGQRPAAGKPGRDQLPRPVYRVAQQQVADAGNAANAAPVAGGEIPAASPQQHPLVPALQIAYAALANMQNNVKDYSCTIVKRERINDKLNDMEFMYLQVRHQPFSVYMYFLGPEKVKGQEALYVEGKNNGNLLGHGVGIRKIAGTVPLLPTGAMAMQGQRYPITEIGMLNLTKRLIEVAEIDKNFGESDVKFFKGTKINKRSCMCIQVTHPVPRKNFRFHLARVFIDDELQMPVRYEAWDWPEKQGGPPILLEEYTYTDIKLNNNFTDFDFDENNSKYHFK